MTTFTPAPQTTHDIPQQRATSVWGHVTIHWLSADHVRVATTGAHVNDDNEAITYRGRSYLVDVHLKRFRDGWVVDGWTGVTDRAKWATATEHQRETIAAALLGLFKTVVSANMLRMAERAHLDRELHQGERVLATMRTELADKQAQVIAQEAALADLLARRVKVHLMSDRHPTVDLPAYLEGPRLPYDPNNL